MKLADLVLPIDQMSNEELIERLRLVRHNREIVRPAARRHVERSEAKTSRSKVKKTGDLFDELTEAERDELIKKLTSE